MHFHRIKNSIFTLALGVLGATLGLTACASSAAGPVQAELPKIEIQVGTIQITAEVANTDTSRQIGMMNRESLGKDEGMLFVFKRSETQCMWMKNTLIDLDVAFADESGKILNVAQMKAGTDDIHCSSGNAKLALEMNLNWFAGHNLGEGHVMRLPESTR